MIFKTMPEENQRTLESVFHLLTDVANGDNNNNMGIPSYFSFLIKNHAYIVKKLNNFKQNIDNLYLDSNSIIYEARKERKDAKKKGNA